MLKQVQVVLLHDPNSSDPVQVLWVQEVGSGTYEEQLKAAETVFIRNHNESVEEDGGQPATVMADIDPDHWIELEDAPLYAQPV